MNLFTVVIIFSSLSFFGYAFSYFNGTHMKKEFKRFGLEKMGLFTIILEILGALGLLIGVLYHPILIISSLGLSLLMFAGVLVRIKVKDNIWISLPAFLYMLVNAYIFWTAIN